MFQIEIDILTAMLNGDDYSHLIADLSINELKAVVSTLTSLLD